MRSSVRLLFALIKDEPSEPVGAEVDSKGGGAILRSGPATAAKSTFALTHPSNLRETRARIVRAASTRSHARGGGFSRGTVRMPNALGLEHAAIAQQRIEDAGEATGERDHGDLFPPACGDAQGPGPQFLRLRLAATEDRDGGLNQANGCASGRPW